MTSSNRLNCKIIQKMSQAKSVKGLRDPECGGSLSPSFLSSVGGLARGDQGERLELVPLPLQLWA